MGAEKDARGAEPTFAVTSRFNWLEEDAYKSDPDLFHSCKSSVL